MRDSVPVYSTASGKLCPDCGQPVKDCRCPKRVRPAGDGIVRVRRETKGRKGKIVTTVMGVPLPETELEALASELKRKIGCGGAVKEGAIVIQGDKVDPIIRALQEKGWTVKRSGG